MYSKQTNDVCLLNLKQIFSRILRNKIPRDDTFIEKLMTLCSELTCTEGITLFTIYYRLTKDTSHNFFLTQTHKRTPNILLTRSDLRSDLPIHHGPPTPPPIPTPTPTALRLSEPEDQKNLVGNDSGKRTLWRTW